MPDSKVHYEKSDVQIGGIIGFGVALFVMLFIVQAAAVWLFDDFKDREKGRYPPLPSLVVGQDS
jgi:hypothetical protein